MGWRDAPLATEPPAEPGTGDGQPKWMSAPLADYASKIDFSRAIPDVRADIAKLP